MKHMRFINWLVVSLPLTLALFFLPLLPHQIPIHFGFNGVANRFSTKYEFLIVPIAALVLHLFWFFVALIICKKKDENEAQKRKNLIAICVINCIFNVIMLLITIESLVKVIKNLDVVLSIDGAKIVSVGLSYLLIVIGYVLPLIKRNVFIGIRTNATLQNDNVWFQVHLFARISMFVGGAISLICCCLSSGICSIVLFGIIGGISTIIPVFYSFGKRNRV